MTQASIITIGDELLIGQVIDTNSAWIAQELNKAGVAVVRRVAVGDVWDEIWNALNEESSKADIILITGGLGPTSDDITKPLLCKYFGGKLIVNEDALENVKYLFEKVFKRPLIERNIKQAEMPDNCIVLQNKRGTAPGMLFKKNNKIFVSMPGVPHEMKGMMEDDVIPFVAKHFVLPHIIHKTLLVAGIGESAIAEMIKDFEAALPQHIKLAYLPDYGMVRLRLTTSGTNKQLLQEEVTKQFLTLQALVKDNLVTNEDEKMHQVIAKMLLQKNETLSTAESCTGGYIAHLITSMSGSSKYFNGGVVSYSNDAKQKVLHVNEQTITLNGAVSEQTVTEMAKGALQQFNTTYAIAVSGIMGPDGGTAEKPVGTVWIAVGSSKKIVTKKLQLPFNRQRNIEMTAMNALNFLRMFMIS